MISGPLAPDLTRPAGPWWPAGLPRSRSRPFRIAGVTLLALSVVILVAWVIFISPLGFTRYPLNDLDRTFTIHRAGTYVVYFEFPGESRPALPPALRIGVVALSGQQIEVHPIGTPGVVGAASAYDLGRHEGRAVAVIVAHRAGTFVVSITPTPAGAVDTSQQRIVTEGTIALGRDWSGTWLASGFGFGLVVIVPMVAGLILLVLAWLRRGEFTDGR
jgi:hypothetical protein